MSSTAKSSAANRVAGAASAIADKSVAVNADVLARFKRLSAVNRLAHAYLFSGPAGAGKTETALAIAQLVNCEHFVMGANVPASSGVTDAHAAPINSSVAVRDKNAATAGALPCGACSSCRKIVSGNHPDVHIIGVDTEEEAGTIKIDDIRHVLGRTALRAYEGRVKVFIMANAERMTTEAANSLLKTLEEPSPNTLMILTTAVPEACLDTIKSRCHKIGFFSDSDPMPADRNRILNAFMDRNNGDEYIKELGADKQLAAEAMLSLLGLVRDGMLYRSGVGPDSLIYKDRMPDVQRMSQRRMEDLAALNTQIVHVRSLIDENLNVKMALSLVRQRIWGN